MPEDGCVDCCGVYAGGRNLGGPVVGAVVGEAVLEPASNLLQLQIIINTHKSTAAVNRETIVFMFAPRDNDTRAHHAARFEKI